MRVVNVEEPEPVVPQPIYTIELTQDELNVVEKIMREIAVTAVRLEYHGLHYVLPSLSKQVARKISAELKPHNNAKPSQIMIRAD